MRYAVLLCLMIYLSSASGVRPTCRRTFRFSEMACAEFQPRIRSPLARVMYQKMMNDLGDKQDHAHVSGFLCTVVGADHVNIKAHPKLNLNPKP